jgi:hypothetical protein
MRGEPPEYNEIFQQAFHHLKGEVDENFLKLSFNALIMYYADTKRDYPNHTLNLKLESVVGIARLEAWGRILRDDFKSRNVQGLPASVLSSDEEFNISSKSVGDHMKDQNKAIRLVNTVLSEKLHQLECTVGEMRSEMRDLRTQMGVIQSDMGDLVSILKRIHGVDDRPADPPIGVPPIPLADDPLPADSHPADPPLFDPLPAGPLFAGPPPVEPITTLKDMSITAGFYACVLKLRFADDLPLDHESLKSRCSKQGNLSDLKSLYKYMCEKLDEPLTPPPPEFSTEYYVWYNNFKRITDMAAFKLFESASGKFLFMPFYYVIYTLFNDII